MELPVFTFVNPYSGMLSRSTRLQVPQPKDHTHIYEVICNWQYSSGHKNRNPQIFRPTFEQERKWIKTSTVNSNWNENNETVLCRWLTNH